MPETPLILPSDMMISLVCVAPSEAVNAQVCMPPHFLVPYTMGIIASLAMTFLVASKLYVVVGGCNADHIVDARDSPAIAPVNPPPAMPFPSHPQEPVPPKPNAMPAMDKIVLPVLFPMIHHLLSFDLVFEDHCRESAEIRQITMSLTVILCMIAACHH